MQSLLLPLSWLYGFGMSARNMLFESGLLRVRPAGVPVIAVGNMTAGGTGKTPLVEWLIAELQAQGVRPAMVSRGYGRASRGVVAVSDGVRLLATALEGGDEAVQVSTKFPTVPVVVGERRVDAAGVAVERFGAEVIVLDDAFQHRYLRRDLDIVILDARVDVTRERMLPAGRRREPLRGLGRAGLLAFSKLAEGQANIPWRSDLGAWSAAPAVFFRTVPGPLRQTADGAEVAAETFRTARILALSAIADNKRFEADLRGLGLDVVAALGFADHHRYSSADIERVLETAVRSGVSHVATTEKDLPRLQAGPGRKLLEQVPVMVLPIEVRWVEGEEVVRSVITGLVKRKGAT
jgi:tetraacyldisaccharide 4'-kinase